ncbi:MAG TPA: hypothetical protein PK941_01710 [Paludibacter sp.]|nr:hypothetical protein [Paludibacter sp.]
MTDEELIEEFIDVQESSKGIALRVCCITWPHPHEPKSHWHTALVLPPSTSIETVKNEMQKLLMDKKHFTVCVECHERNPRGWMHTRKICQACAEKNHGVVY